MKKLFALFILFIVFSASATVQVFPTRVIFDDKDRAATISIRNRGTEQETYNIKAVFFRMGPTGTMDMVESPTKEERSLVEFIRFSPRRVTLKPNEEQVVRLMLKNTTLLPPGDYRAHLRIVPDDTPTMMTAPSENKKDVEMKLIAKVAISISTFYYKGDVKMQGELSHFSIGKDPAKPSQLKFNVNLSNKGTAFLVGAFKLFHVSPDGKEKQIGLVDGIFSYSPERKIEYSIEPTEKVDLSKGTVRLKFFGPSFFNEPLISTAETKAQ